MGSNIPDSTCFKYEGGLGGTCSTKTEMHIRVALDLVHTDLVLNCIIYLFYVRRIQDILCCSEFCLLFSPIELIFFCGLTSLPQPQNNSKKKFCMSVCMSVPM